MVREEHAKLFVLDSLCTSRNICETKCCFNAVIFNSDWKEME